MNDVCEKMIKRIKNMKKGLEGPRKPRAALSHFKSCFYKLFVEI